MVVVVVEAGVDQTLVHRDDSECRDTGRGECEQGPRPAERPPHERVTTGAPHTARKRSPIASAATPVRAFKTMSTVRPANSSRLTVMSCHRRSATRLDASTTTVAFV